MLIGGQAVLFYGEPGLTRDVDITPGVTPDLLEKLKSVTRDLDLKILVSDVENFVNETYVLLVPDEESNFRADFIFSFSPYESQAIKRAKIMDIGESKVKFVSLEDLIIHKIIAGRSRDIEYVKSVLLKNQNFDKKYILKWLREFDVSPGENFKEKFEKIVTDEEL